MVACLERTGRDEYLHRRPWGPQRPARETDLSQSREIENEIKERLRHVGLLETLRVQVNDGTATLEGAVKARHDRQTAERAVAAVEGVAEVENLIQVSGNSRSDDAIERDIATYFLWSPLVNFDDIRVQVDNGVVTLEGSVEHLGYRDVLAIDIQNILGVLRVDVSKIVPKPLKAFPTAKAEAEKGVSTEVTKGSENS